MRAIFDEGKLDYNAVTEIMNELKPNQVEKLKIPMEKIREFVPRGCDTPKDCLDYLFRLLKEDHARRAEQDVQKKSAAVMTARVCNRTFARRYFDE